MEINIERLEILLDHMRSDKRGHNRFDFSCIGELNITPIGTICGSSGCMLGELPLLFPTTFRFGQHYTHIDFYLIYILNEKSNWTNKLDVIYSFFGLTEEMGNHIFQPDEQFTNLYGGIRLNIDSSLEDVLSNLEIFIDLAKSGKFDSL